MTINNSQFKNLIESIPNIEVSLAWEHEEGHGEFEGHEINSKDYLISVNFTVYESGTIDSGDYSTEPSFTSNGHTSEIHGFEVFDNDGEEIKPSLEQKKQIINKIQSNITTI